MDNFMAMANSGVLYLIAGVVIAFVMILAAVFLVKAYREGVKIGMDKKKMHKAITSSIAFTVVPSVSILIGVIAEVITYAPMLGTGATYLAFITGNLTNLKIPCCMTARDIVGTKYGTKENEIISTISVAVSSLVTCTVLILGVLLLAPLTPILQSPVLQPAFNTVVPALFGALGYKYFSKTPLVAVAPFLCMTALCLLVPAAASQVAILVPVSALISIGAARLLYVKGVLQ